MAYQLQEISAKLYENWFSESYLHLQHRSPFHQPAWLNASARGVGFSNVYIGIYNGHELVGALPGYLTRRGPVRLFGSPMRGTMTSYLGPTGIDLGKQPDQMVELITQCNEFVRKQWHVQYARFALRNAPETGKFNMPANWQQQRSSSYRLDLTPGHDAVWTGLKSDCRRNIRKARKAGIEINQLNDPALFYQMLDQTLRRHQSTSFHSEQFFRLLFDSLLPADAVWPWVISYQGKEIAVGLFVHDDTEMHFVSGASLPEFGNLPTSYLLHWHAIETAINAGLKVFNSDASRVRSIDRFKESFRPKLEKRFTLTWAPKYIYQAQKKFISGYRQLRRFRAWLGSA